MIPLGFHPIKMSKWNEDTETFSNEEKKISLEIKKYEKSFLPSSKMHFNGISSLIIHLRQIYSTDEVEKLKFYTNNKKVARQTAAPVISLQSISFRLE